MIYGFSEITLNIVCSFAFRSFNFKYRIINIAICHTDIYATGYKTNIIARVGKRFRRNIFMWFWFGSAFTRDCTFDGGRFWIECYLCRVV